MTKYTYRSYESIQPFEEPISVARHPRVLRHYLNNALDELETYFTSPTRDPNFGLGSFTQHISPNTGSGQKLEWMLKHSGLIKANQGVGVYAVTSARLTDLGAEHLLDEYRGAKRIPTNAVDEAIAIERETADIRLAGAQAEIERLQTLLSAAGNIALNGENPASPEE